MGRYTYTTDLRFEAFHSPHTEDWILQLRNPKSSDSGVYECQISTTPHLTHKINLTVYGKLKLHLVVAIIVVNMHFNDNMKVSNKRGNIILSFIYDILIVMKSSI